MADEEAAVILASDAWARAVELVTEAEGRDDSDDKLAKVLESAELELYQAVLAWRHKRRH
jgi:hypothetical protein